MRAGSKLSIYAELLSNIRQVSIVASIPSPADSSTAAQVSADGSRIQIRHGTDSEELLLPGRVIAPPVLPIQRTAANVLSWRLPLSSAQPAAQSFTLESQTVPWAATDLFPESKVSCRHCQQVAVPEGRITVWKDLPSENWAEMMDFWHCHKPTEHHHGQQDENLTSRGYGANSAIAAQPGVGLVDLTSFLLAESDCTGLVFSISTAGSCSGSSSAALDGIVSPKMLLVFCSGCKTQIGIFNVTISSVVLFKWQVSCQTESNNAPPTSSDCLAASLIATLSRSGSSKSVVIPTFASSPPPEAEAGDVNMGDSSGTNGSAYTDTLHLWILNSNIKYSSTHHLESRSAMKLLFRIIPREEAEKMLESLSSDVQEVNLPKEAIGSVVQVLQATNELLPNGERIFKEWHVGLLDKWDK